MHRVVAAIAALAFSLWMPDALAQPATQPTAPAVPRVDSVVPLANQPQADDPATIWFDDFDGPEKRYAESSGGLDDTVSFGGAGRSMPCLYEKGQRGAGNRKVFFGDCPASRGSVVRNDRRFDEIYFRFYVRHQPGWTGGGPDKMARATSLVSDRWQQAMIAHLWSAGEVLTLDPATGVRDGRVVTRHYNDFANLRWLGNRPTARLPMFSTQESGWWVCVECRAKLNIPGRKDGENQLWIDGRLEAERKGLDWRGTYTSYGINAVFLEAYWNEGSPVRQVRWFDNFVIAAAPVGPVLCPPNPTLIKTPYHGPGTQKAWQLELAADEQGHSVVWQSTPQGPADRVTVSTASGRFVGPLQAARSLPPGRYYARIRQQSTTGPWSAWSPWHQGFAVADPTPE